MKMLSSTLLDHTVACLEAEFHPAEIYLFGSHAWGTPHQDSDIDIMVIVEESEEKPIRRMQRAHKCLNGVRVSKDVFVQTRKEFDRYKDLPSSLQHEILERGKKLYG